MPATKNYILDEAVIEKKLRRMALEIIENNHDEKKIFLAGIKESGSVVARCVGRILEEISEFEIEYVGISLDKKNPKDVLLDTKTDFSNKVIIIVDDVANSGRTLLYAIKPFLEYQPKKIEALVLISRRHNSFPVFPDYVGLSIATTLQELIIVEVSTDKVLGAYMK